MNLIENTIFFRVVSNQNRFQQIISEPFLKGRALQKPRSINSVTNSKY
jgi:hypothetical protein